MFSNVVHQERCSRITERSSRRGCSSTSASLRVCTTLVCSHTTRGPTDRSGGTTALSSVCSGKLLNRSGDEHRNDWDVYLSAPAYDYNSHVQRSTKTTPFELLLSKPPAYGSLHHSVTVRLAPNRKKEAFLCRMDSVLQATNWKLIRTQERYKRDFDTRVREVSRCVHTVDFVCLDPTDGSAKAQPATTDIFRNSKLRTIAVGLFHRLRNDVCTFLNDRDGGTEWTSAHHAAYGPFLSQLVPSSATPADLAAKICTSPTYTVEKLLNHRITYDNNTKFLVK